MAKGKLGHQMQRRSVEAKYVKHNNYNCSIKAKFHKNYRLVGKRIWQNLSIETNLIKT